MSKKNKNKKQVTIAGFSCPFVGVIPYLRQLSESEQTKHAQYLAEQVALGHMRQEDAQVPTVDQAFKPFPCTTVQKGEVLRCKFYQPILDFVGDDESGDWECILMLKSKTDVMKNISEIEVNEMKISLMELQIDECMAKREDLGLPDIDHPLEEEDEEEDEEEGEEEDNADFEEDEEQEEIKDKDGEAKDEDKKEDQEEQE